MATPDSETPARDAPWATRRDPSGRHLLRRAVPWLAGLALLAAAGWGLWPKPVPVETGTVSRGPLTVRVTEEGRTRIRNRYVVAAPVAGRMERVALKPGDEVTAGETVITTLQPVAAPLLDPRTRLRAEAAVAMQEAAQRQAAAALEARKVAARMAETDRDRVRGISREGTISQLERDRLEGEAALRAAELRAAEFALQVIDYELAQARAALERPAEESTPERVAVTSPVSGRVLKVMQESEMVVAAGQPILEVGDPADLEIEAEILSRDAVAIQPGDAVEIVQWGGEAPLQGRVRRIEPAAFTKISALGVEEQRVIVLSDLVDPPPAARALGDRFRVEVRVAVWHGEDVLTAPAGALFRQGNEWKAYRFAAGTAERVDISAGHSDGRQTEILGGLNAGDEVLVHPPDNVEDGSAVVRRED